MIDQKSRCMIAWLVLLWAARLAGTAVVVLLMLVVIRESGTGPSGVRECTYLALFPFGFSVGYLLGWRWPLVAGWVSLGCMAASQIVLGRVFPIGPYVVWGILSLPGVLYVLAGWKLRSRTGGVQAAATG
jgi:hypothetical protein